jgi:polyisoprenoid-binding protein YceI
MRRNLVIAVAAVLVVLGGGVAWFLAAEPPAPTPDVTAPPLTTAAPEDGSDTTATSSAGSSLTFSLTDETRATFEIDEVLRGRPNRVVGTSDIVLGEFSFDPDDLSTIRIGTILVNARAFRTDSSLRDRAINGPILDTGSFEFIEFTPTAVDGLAGSAAPGDSFEFTVTGDLTIRDVTHPATFRISATWVDEDRIEGTATAVVTRSDYGLVIPQVPSVADVSDEVTLTLSFVAERT